MGRGRSDRGTPGHRDRKTGERVLRERIIDPGDWRAKAWNLRHEYPEEYARRGRRSSCSTTAPRREGVPTAGGLVVVEA